MKIMKNLIIVVITLFLSYLLASFFGKMYSSIIPITEAGFFVLPRDFSQFILGLISSYIFTLNLLFTGFGGEKKYWWICILLIPALVIEALMDFPHIYLPIALGLIGWGLGYGISKLILIGQKQGQK